MHPERGSSSDEHRCAGSWRQRVDREANGRHVAASCRNGTDGTANREDFDNRVSASLRPKHDHAQGTDPIRCTWQDLLCGDRRWQASRHAGGTFIRTDLAGAGALADIGCYSLDMALNPLGYPKPLTVSAVATNHFGTNPAYHREADKFQVEDFGSALIRLEGGLTLNFKISWAMHMDTLGATMFLGTDAGLKVTSAGSGPWSGVWDGGVGSVTMYHDLQGSHVETHIPVKQHSVKIFAEKVKDFVGAIQEGRQRQSLVARSCATKRSSTAFSGQRRSVERLKSKSLSCRGQW